MKTIRFALVFSLFLTSLGLFAQTSDVTKGCFPLQVNFTPPAGSTSYVWNFGNGQSSVLASPTTTYSSPGTYTATFKQTAGGPTIGSITVVVFPKPIINAVANPQSGCRPLNVGFTPQITLDTAVNITNYEWTYGDGSPAGNGSTINHTYTTSGTFTPSLQITTNYPTCDATQIFTDLIKVSNSPQVAISTSPNPPVKCDPPLTVDFGVAASGGQAPLTFAWTFGNGNTSAQQIPSSQTYTTNGNFPVKLVVTDALGCSTTATRNVNVGNPTIDAALPDTVCAGVEFDIINNSTAGANNWNFGPNAIPQTSNQAKPKVKFTAPGVQTVTLTVTASGGCSSSKTFTVYVDAADASFTAVPAYSCQDPTQLQYSATANNSTAWKWTFSNASTSTVRNPNFTWTDPDTTGYSPLGQHSNATTLVVTTGAGCMDTATVSTEIWLPNAKFIPSVQHGCAPLQVTFMDESTSKENITTWEYIWMDGTGNTVVTSSMDVPHTFTQAGDYNVTLVITNTAGCRDTSYAILIEVGAPITGDFTADVTSVCPGDTVRFTSLSTNPNIDAWHFSSESDRQWHCFNEANPIWIYNNETGPLDVTLTLEYNGCFNSVTKNDYITVKGPIAKAYYKTTCDNTRLFEFTDRSSGADSIKWYFAGDSSMMPTFTHLFPASGAQTIVLEATNNLSGCAASYDTFTVYPTQVVPSFEVMDTLCGGTPLVLDASASLDVNATCYKGYTWYFDWDRPIRTDSMTTTVDVPLSGNYMISLEVEDINGCKDTLDVNFVAVELSPAFTPSKQTICNPSTVTFTDETYAEIGIESWEWDFGDGGMSTDQNPTHTFTTPPPGGSYNVVLKVTDKHGCPQSTSRVINWYIPTSTVSSVPLPQVCKGTTLALTASDFTTYGSNLSWKWSYAGVEKIGQTASYTFNTSGQQTVNLTYTELATGCPGASIFNVDVQDYPIASFTLDDTDPICAPANLTLTNTSLTGSPLTTNWTLGNGVSTTGNVVSGSYPKGTYTAFMHTQTSYGCADSTSKTFNVVGPEGNFTMSELIICLGDEVTFTGTNFVDVDSYSWGFGDGTVLDNQNPAKHVFSIESPTDQRIVQLTLRGQGGQCLFTLEKTLNFSPVEAKFSTLTPQVCFGSPNVFINNSTAVDEALWSFGDGTTSTTIGNQTHSYTTAGTYNVTLVVTDTPLGCKDTLTLPVIVSDHLDVFAYGDTICPGDIATIGVSNPAADLMYAWTPNVLPPASAPVVKAQPAQNTNYTVVASDDFGCTGTATVSVNVATDIQGIMSYDTLLGKDATWKILTPIAGYNYNWTPSSLNQNQTVTITQTDTFLLTVTDFMGCFEKDYVFRVRVVPTEIAIPNAFTPDGDATNDVFKILVRCGEDDITQSEVIIENFQIYNRWGNKVYETAGGTALNTQWDGMDNGKLAPADVYIYNVTVRFPNGTTVQRAGDVSLIR